MARLTNIPISLSGRKHETKRLRRLLKTTESELVAVIGRRRVGKTFLIKRVYDKELIFSITGIQNASKANQLNNFILALQKASNTKVLFQRPKDWIAAFALLKEFISGHPSKKKKVLFFYELTWLASPRSGFI